MTDVKWLELLEKSPKKAHTMLIEEYGGYVYAVVIDKCKRELWVVFNLQSNKIAFEYQSIIF